MKSTTSTMARRDLHKLMGWIQDSHEPICITSKQGSGILISEEDFAAIQETLHLQSIPGMTESIKEGMNTTIEKAPKS